MRRTIRKAIPSMFHRRLFLLGAVAVVMVMLLCAQLFRLTVVEAAERRERAEAALRTVRFIETRRGLIRDRKFRILAEDSPGYDIAVDYEVLTRQWAQGRARELARKDDPDAWRNAGPNMREQLAAPFQRQFENQIDQMWNILCDLTDNDREEVESHRTKVVSRVQRLKSHLTDARRKRELAAGGRNAPLSKYYEPILEEKIAHPVLFDINANAKAQVESLIAEAEKGEEAALEVWTRVDVVRAKRRHYSNQTFTIEVDRSTFPGPLRTEKPITVTAEGVGVHLVGDMRTTWKEDLVGDGTPENPGRPFDAEKDLGGYFDGDLTGKWGVERAYERHLRGSRGKVTIHRDTKKEDRIEPIPGEDATLSIDIQLQARIQALMSPEVGLMRRQFWHTAKPFPFGPEGEELHGAAVVLDVARSEVLAAVSVPTFSMQLLSEQPELIYDDKIANPFMNRVIARKYQPGSTVKPMVLSAAITDRKIASDGVVDCNGKLFPEVENAFRCWIYKHYNDMTHNITNGGPLRGRTAIKVSCNIFFYTMGMRLGAKRLVEWYEAFGLGQLSGSGLPAEVEGDLPDLEELARNPNTQGFTRRDAAFMAIGQGAVGWTPLQAVTAYAALARGGYYISPTFVINASADNEQISRDLRLNPRGVEEAMEGLRLAVTEKDGTAHHISFPGGVKENIFNIEDVVIYGKSGTADAVPLRIDSDGDERITRADQIVKDGDHAWVIVMVKKPGSPRPDYVVAVIVEYAGSGGRVAGPIVNQILHIMRAEGYL